MSTHTVFRFSHRNGFDGLHASTEPIPQIDAHEVLIKVRSVALNFRDIAIARSQYPFPVKDDVVPCSDAMGEIVDVGASVPGFHKGDKVIVAFDPTALYGTIDNWENGLGGPVDGVLREYINVAYSGVVKLPEQSTLKDEEWASLVCTGVTAWNSLYGNIPLRPGQTVLFQGTGGVSVTGLALAKAAGAKTIITSSSDAKLEYVQKTFGADLVINYKTTPDWAAEARKITRGKGVDYILENGGSGTIQQSIEAIAHGGIISVMGFLSKASQDEMPDVAGLVLLKGCVVRGIITGSKQQLEEVVRFVGSRNLGMPVEKVFAVDKKGVVEAMECLASGGHVGKVCIKVA